MPRFRTRVALALLWGAASAHAATPPAAAANALPPLDASTVLLVVAPHPDDETLCCAGAIQRVLQGGGRVSIVWLTSGDGSPLGSLVIEHSLLADPVKMRAYGLQRMSEARAATARLSLTPAGQLFLGYPDGGLLALLTQYRVHAYHSRFTGVAAVPYTQALFPQHPYTGAALEQDFAAVIRRVQPTLVLAPSPLDSHPDHHAAGLLAMLSAQERPAALVRYWIVHGGEGWPTPRGLVPGVPLSAPPLGASIDLVPFALSVPEEDHKLAALRAYTTQLRIMEPFLLAFVRTTELFASRAGVTMPSHL